MLCLIHSLWIDWACSPLSCEFSINIDFYLPTVEFTSFLSRLGLRLSIVFPFSCNLNSFYSSIHAWVAHVWEFWSATCAWEAHNQESSNATRTSPKFELSWVPSWILSMMGWGEYIIFILCHLGIPTWHAPLPPNPSLSLSLCIYVCIYIYDTTQL